MKLYSILQGFFLLKISDKLHILPLMPHRMAQKFNCVHAFANNAEH